MAIVFDPRVSPLKPEMLQYYNRSVSSSVGESAIQPQWKKLHFCRSQGNTLKTKLPQIPMDGNETEMEQTRESLEGLRKYVAANVHPDKLK